MLDWVIRGGTVIDGSGGAPFRADIGICGGKIAAVGSCGEAAQTLEAAGRYVTPGFLDIHRHGDAAVFRPGFGRAELRQGLTTIVNGNCGLSLAPFGAAHRAELRRYLGAITGDIDPAIPTESMAAYLDALRARPLPLHVGMLVGGGTVRADCCGYAPGDADEALPELHRRLERALADGALGVSLGLGYARSASTRRTACSGRWPRCRAAAFPSACTCARRATWSATPCARCSARRAC